MFPNLPKGLGLLHPDVKSEIKSLCLNQFGSPLCNNRSRRHGYHQKVINVSAYQSKYFYPDWRVRVYYQNIPFVGDENL